MGATTTGDSGAGRAPLTSPDHLDAAFVPRPVPDIDEVAVAGGIVLRIGWQAAVALNATGGLIWGCFDGKATLGEVAAELSEATGADVEVVSADVLAVARQLGAEGFLAGVGFADGEGVDWELVAVPDLAVGEEVADSQFQDLDGAERTLAELKGRESFVVNWSPDCGYCWAMAERLAVLVEPLAAKGVQVVLVASGTAESNRAVAEAAGLTCPILLRTGDTDPFIGHGTPCAYHLDAETRLLVPIVHGTEGVLDTASALAGVDPVTLFTDHDSDPVPAGTRYLLGDDGTCAPGAGGGPVSTWLGTRVYRLDHFHVGIRYDSDATARVLDALFDATPVRDRRAGHSFSVALPNAASGAGDGVGHRLNLLVAGGAAEVRSRYPSRVLRALLWRLDDEIHGHVTPPGRVRVDAKATLVDGGALLLPRSIDAFGAGFQSRLARAGIAVADLRYPEIDLETAELVVNESRISHDRSVLDSLDVAVDSPAELAPVRPGRYPLLGWGVLRPGHVSLVELAPWEASAATLSLLWEVDDPSTSLRDLGELFGKVRGFGLWYLSESELVTVISQAAAALTSGSLLERGA